MGYSYDPYAPHWYSTIYILEKIIMVRSHSFSVIFFTLGSVLVLGAVILYGLEYKSQAVTHQMAAEAAAAFELRSDPQEQGLVPIRIHISDRVETEISTEFYQDGSWSISEHTASYLAGSGYPTQPGNTIIYGHDSADVFENLKGIQNGELVTLKLVNGDERVYEVIDVANVKPSQMRYLQNTPDEVLTLYTCDGLFDQNRLVVRAVPI